MFWCLVSFVQIRFIQTVSLDSVWGHGPPVELLSWVTSCPMGEKEGAAYAVGGERLEVKGSGALSQVSKVAGG